MRKFAFVNDSQMDVGTEALKVLHSSGIATTGRVIRLPKRATKGSAGYDIACPATSTLKPGQEAKIPTFIKVYLNHGEFLAIFPRSGLGFKYYWFDIILIYSALQIWFSVINVICQLL